MDKLFFAEIFKQNSGRYFEEWKELLRFKSVSTDPSGNEECLKCARYLENQLKKLEFKSELIDTPGKPLVYGERIVQSAAPCVLFYGHYDVQPPDPLELWETPPFEPTLKDGRIYARGAEDNKGQLHYVLKAIEALIEAKQLNCNIKILLEGEEECGSGGLSAVLPNIAPRIHADVLMVCDTGSPHPDYATITMGLRGIIHLEATLRGPNRDLHSGVHGGIVKNPAAQMARLVASLHDSDGKVAVAGFYDGVVEPSAEDRKLANQMPFSAQAYKDTIGVAPSGGESGYSVSERRGFRPTLEVNGLFGGYTGAGTKTIIPSHASVKLTARLVRAQDPDRVFKAIKNHLQQHAPQDLTLEVNENSEGAAAFSLSSASKVIARARTALEGLCPAGTLLMWEGASIPIVPALAAAANAEPLLVGFGLEDDRIHAPNESFSLEQYRHGFLYACRFLSSFSA